MRTNLQISLASTFVVCLVILFVALESRSALRAEQANNEIHGHIVPGLRYLGQMRFGVIRIVASVSELIVVKTTGMMEGESESEPSAPKEAEVDFIESGKASFQSALRGLWELHRDASLEQSIHYGDRLEDIVDGFERLVTVAEQIIELVEQDAELERLAEAKERFEAIEVELLGRLAGRLDGAQALLDEKHVAMARAIAQLRNDIVVLGLIIILLLVGYAMFVVRLIQREANSRTEAEHWAEENAREIKRRKLIETRLASHQKMEALGTMLGGIAHSVNNFLTPIITLAHMQKMDAPEGSEQQQDLEHILRSAQSASAVLKDVLAFSHEKTGNSRGICELVACLRKVLPIARAAMPSSVMLEEKIELDEAWVPSKVADIETIILNLTGNAIDAMLTGRGQVSIGLSAARVVDGLVDGAPVRLEAGDYIRLSVADSGTGIPEEFLSNIFDPFFTTKEVGKGSGLGLAITYTSVTEAGGDILVTSKQGKGTRFDIFLPRLEPPTAAAVE